FGLGDGGGGALGRVLDVADALVGKLKKTDIHGHNFSPLVGFRSEKLWQIFRGCKVPPCISAAPAALDRYRSRLYRPCRSPQSLHSAAPATGSQLRLRDLRSEVRRWTFQHQPRQRID